MTFFYFLLSLLCLLYLCDISSPTARVIWYSRFSRPLKYLFIRYYASLFLPPLAVLLILRDVRVSVDDHRRLSVKPLADTDVYDTYVCAVSLAAQLPSAGVSTMHAQQDPVFVRVVK